MQTQLEQQKQIANLQNNLANSGVNQQKEVVQQPVKTTKKIENNDPKPDRVVVTVSWLWWALSTQTTAIGETYYWTESYPINSEKAAQEYVNYWFTAWWRLTVGCNDGYTITKCAPFSKTDSVDNQLDQYGWCFLWNENPNLMRTSVVVECRKN